MYARMQVLRKIYQPAAVGAGETAAVFPVKAGTRVWAASARVLIAAAASTQTTIELGDGTDTDGFIVGYDTETNAAGAIIGGGGAFLANSGGKLYTADDTVDAVYAVTTAGATNPKVAFCLVVSREWPGPGAV